MQKWLVHPEAERIYRGRVQYALALRHGAAGREVLAHAHFYMAGEALTKALLRDECLREGNTQHGHFDDEASRCFPPGRQC